MCAGAPSCWNNGFSTSSPYLYATDGKRSSARSLQHLSGFILSRIGTSYIAPREEILVHIITPLPQAWRRFKVRTGTRRSCEYLLLPSKPFNKNQFSSVKITWYQYAASFAAILLYQSRNCILSRGVRCGAHLGERQSKFDTLCNICWIERTVTGMLYFSASWGAVVSPARASRMIVSNNIYCCCRFCCDSMIDELSYKCFREHVKISCCLSTLISDNQPRPFFLREVIDRKWPSASGSLVGCLVWYGSVVWQ